MLIVTLSMAALDLPAQYTVQYLQPPAENPSYSDPQPYVLNNLGQTFGEARGLGGTGVPVLWNSDGVGHTLPVPEGYSVGANPPYFFLNDSGLAVAAGGTTQANGSSVGYPILWQNGAFLAILNKLPTPDCSGADVALDVTPIGLNNAGDVLVEACGLFYVLTQASGYQYGNPIPGPAQVTGCGELQNTYFPAGNHLNDADEVAIDRTYYINSGCPLYNPEPTLFTPGGSATPVPIAGNSIQINDQGEITIFIDDGGVGVLEFWDGTAIHDLGYGGYSSLNNLGQIAFGAGQGTDLTWSLYQNGVATPLQLPTGVQFNAGVGIGLLLNDVGQIVGQVSSGETAAVLLTPTGTAPANLTFPVLGSALSGTAATTLRWSPGLGATAYVLRLGTTGPGANDLFDSNVTTALTASAGPFPTNGVTIYATLYSFINGGWQEASSTFIEPGTTVPAALMSPASGSTLSSTAATPFSWTPGTGATAYVLRLGDIGPGSDDLYDSNVTHSLSATVGPLPADGVPVYATLYSLINGAWQQTNYTFNETGMTAPATLTSPASGSTLSSTAATNFTWTAGAGASIYVLRLGTLGPGSNDLYDSNVVSSLSASAGPFPANGVPVYATLYSLIEGAWQPESYTFVESGLNEWTWMGGSSTTPSAGSGEPGVYGTLGTPAAANVPGGRFGASSWTDANGNLWLFGGSGPDSSNNLNDMWEFTPSTNEWAWMGGSMAAGEASVYGTLGAAAPGNIPGSRQSASTWTDSSGNLWLFGGYAYQGGVAFGYLNDLWRFNPSSNEWAWMGGSSTGSGEAGVYGSIGQAALGNLPGSRTQASTWTDGSGHLWLFGGAGSDANGTQGFLNDLWEFNPSTNQWTWMSGSSTVPSPNTGQPGVYGTQGTSAAANVPGGRDSAATWTDINGNLWLFGGFGYDTNGAQTLLNDLWEFDSSTNQWTWVSGSNSGGAHGVYGTLGQAAAGNYPGARYPNQGWTDSNGHFWLFGGSGFAANGVNDGLNDLWEYNQSINEWTWMGGNSNLDEYGVYGALGVSAASNAPGWRQSASSWKDRSGNFWLFGGYGYGAYSAYGYLNDLWRYQP